MRISAAIMTGLVFTATTSVAWSLGLREPAQDPLLVPLDALPAASPATSNQPATQSARASATEPTTSSSPAATPTPSATGGSQAQATATPSPSSATAAPADPAPAATAAPAPAQPVVVTKTSDVINYKYGVVQISMTKTDSTITDVTLLQGDASYGRDAAYAALINATIQVQGTGYGNVTGATFTTEAFKKAVDNVMAKF